MDAAERAADGPTDQQAVMQALHAAYPINIPESIGSIFSFIMGLFGGRRMPPGVEKPPPDPPELRQLFWRLTHTRTWDVVGAWRLASSDALTPLRRTPPREEFHVQADLVRCLFGNPFRPMTLDPAWRTTAAVGLARGIYEANAFDRLPILADALEDAGCDDAAVLAHCRTDAVHARGCYVVDALLSSR